MADVKNITVIGAGTMGHGIAQVAAQSGFQVTLCDLKQEFIDNGLRRIIQNLDKGIERGKLAEEDKKSALAKIKAITNLEEAARDADLVIEAVLEKIELKREVFGNLDRLCPQHTILASNTSSISITRIAAATKRPQQVIGMHFMNPVPVMKLVEIINGYGTDEKTTSRIVELSVQLGKTPCVVKDYPGFVANRILMPMINEAIGTLF